MSTNVPTGVLALAGLAAVISACSGTAVGPPPPTRAASAERVRVADVVDGDTIKVVQAGQLVTVRLIGMDTPETVDPRKPVQCFGPQASARAKALLAGQEVWLAGDPTQSRHDIYRRELAYVWLPDGELYDWLMIRDGFAREYTYRTPYEYQRQFRAAEAAAQREHRGLWSAATCAGGVAGAASATGRGPPS